MTQETPEEEKKRIARELTKEEELARIEIEKDALIGSQQYGSVGVKVDEFVDRRLLEEWQAKAAVALALSKSLAMKILEDLQATLTRDPLDTILKRYPELQKKEIGEWIKAILTRYNLSDAASLEKKFGIEQLSLSNKGLFYEQLPKTILREIVETHPDEVFRTLNDFWKSRFGDPHESTLSEEAKKELERIELKQQSRNASIDKEENEELASKKLPSTQITGQDASQPTANQPSKWYCAIQ